MSSRNVGRWLLRLIVVAAIGGLFAFVLHLRNRDQVQIIEDIRLPVLVARAEPGTVTDSFVIGSYVESEQIVTITPKASGTLLSLTATVGDRVQEGQLIAQVDPEPYELARDQARMTLDAVSTAYDRAQRLHEAGSASDAALDQARSQFEGAQSQLESAELNVNNTRVRSPVTGLVMARHRSAGEVVTTGVAIVTVSNTADLLVSAEVPENYIAHFVAGQRPLAVRAFLPSVPDAGIGAAIKFVSPYIRPESRTFEVACEITGDTRSVVPGMYVELEFVLAEQSNVLTLSFDALVGDTYLWYLDPANGTAHRLELGSVFSDDYRFVVPADIADHWFIVDGQHFLSDGLEVRVLNSADMEEPSPGPS
jgi:RND family efflux transporter MFP subunit